MTTDINDTTREFAKAIGVKVADLRSTANRLAKLETENPAVETDEAKAIAVAIREAIQASHVGEDHMLPYTEAARWGEFRHIVDLIKITG